jgi:hypothetical protein
VVAHRTVLGDVKMKYPNTPVVSKHSKRSSQDALHCCDQLISQLRERVRHRCDNGTLFAKS